MTMAKLLRRIDIARSWQLARNQFAAVVTERNALAQELEHTQQSNSELRERNELLSALRQLQAAVQEREAAEVRFAHLHRELVIRRAEKATRDPAAPLQ
jgi:hypothetical protein